MDILEHTNKLREKLTEFKNSDLFLNNESFRQDIRFIEIMINLTELAYENKRLIEPTEKHWFEGSYIIDTSFTGKWADISNLYSSLIDEINKLRLFK